MLPDADPRVTGADFVRHGSRTLHDPEGCEVCEALGVGRLHGPFREVPETAAVREARERAVASRVFARPRRVELEKGRWKG